jgi:hypothetical protein
MKMTPDGVAATVGVVVGATAGRGAGTPAGAASGVTGADGADFGAGAKRSPVGAGGGCHGSGAVAACGDMTLRFKLRGGILGGEQNWGWR